MSVSLKLTLSVVHLYLQKSACADTSIANVRPVSPSGTGASVCCGSGSVSTIFFLAVHGGGPGVCGGCGVALVL